MAKTRVVNIRREPCDVYIGRGSPWGNPYSHQPSRFAEVQMVATREEAIACYRDYLLARPELVAQLPALKGKRLGCYCKPWHACHGDILVALLEGEPPDPLRLDL